MSPEPALAIPPALDEIRERVEAALDAFLDGCRDEVAALHPQAAGLVDEIRRLLAAGGKRLRPAFCVLGFRAAGGEEGEEIFRAAAALELLHTFALIHDDLMDEAEERRGAPSSHFRFAAEHTARQLSGDPDRFGRSAALLAGDLAAVLADRLLLGSGFPPERLLAALPAYDAMRMAMAAGQFLDVGGAGPVDEAMAGLVARLKTGAYTVAGPLRLGAALAGAPANLAGALARFGEPLGEAFQVRDDLIDAGEEGIPGARAARVNELVAEARAALASAPIEDAAAQTLVALAHALSLPDS